MYWNLNFSTQDHPLDYNNRL